MARSDSYLRLFTNRRSALVGDSADLEDGSIVFVDIDAPPGADVYDVVEAFQYVPRPSVAAETLLVRWPYITSGGDPAEDSLADATISEWCSVLSERTRQFATRYNHIGVVRFRVGDRPAIQWAPSPPPIEEARILARARSAELTTLLELGRGIWRPRDYHYRLPSGHHAEAFVRVADAIRRPRDAVALSTWLLPRMRDELGILMDSGTLTPIVSALHTAIGVRRWRPGPVVVLDDYPSSRADSLRAARDASSGSAGILGVLSVSSSGAMLDRMQEALERGAAADEWSLDVLVNKLLGPTDRYAPVPANDDERTSTWLGLADLGLVSTSELGCKRCRSNQGARIVQIDPRSFESMVLPEPELLTPSTNDGRVNFRLWETAKASAAIGVEAKPHERSAESVPKEYLLGVRVFFERLLTDPTFAPAFAERIGDIRNRSNREDDETANVLDNLGECDVVVSVENDAAEDGFAGVVEALRDHAGLGAGVPFASFDPATATMSGAPLNEASNILVLALGTVTGWTLRQLRIAVEDATAGRPHRVSGLVVHARPTSARDWLTMCNSFSRRLGAVWLTYFPWGSPLRDESELLSVADASREVLGPEAQVFLDRRMSYCSPDDAVVEWDKRVEAYDAHPDLEPDPAATLWGLHLDSANRHLRGQSLFGFELDALTTYAAIGSSVHRRRTSTEPRTAPEWRMFEIPAIVRSYFDAMLVCSVLRWIGPQEAWWGRTLSEARQTMRDLIARSKEHHGDLVVLIPELLLATAQGKVHPEAKSELVDSVPALTATWTAEERAAVEVGLLLLEKFPD